MPDQDELNYDEEEELDEEEYEYDQVTGERAKKPKMAVLNKSKLNKHEMDELFLNY